MPAGPAIFLPKYACEVLFSTGARTGGVECACLACHGAHSCQVRVTCQFACKPSSPSAGLGIVVNDYLQRMLLKFFVSTQANTPFALNLSKGPKVLSLFMLRQAQQNELGTEPE